MLLMHNAIASGFLSNRLHEILKLLTHKQSPALSSRGLLYYLVAGRVAGAVVEALNGVIGRAEGWPRAVLIAPMKSPDKEVKLMF